MKEAACFRVPYSRLLEGGGKSGPTGRAPSVGRKKKKEAGSFPCRSVARCAYIGSNHVRLFKLFVRQTRRKVRRGVRQPRRLRNEAVPMRTVFFPL